MLNNIFIFETTGCFVQVYQEKSAIFRENVLRLLYIDFIQHTTYDAERLRIKWHEKNAEFLGFRVWYLLKR